MQLYYVPCPDMTTAESISAHLLQEKWIACANIVPGMVSLYPWQGKIEKSQEVLLLLKTDISPSKFSELEAHVRSLHPYEVPCLMRLSVETVNSEYLSWIQGNIQRD